MGEMYELIGITKRQFRQIEHYYIHIKHNQKMIFASVILASLSLAQPPPECPEGLQLHAGLCYKVPRHSVGTPVDPKTGKCPEGQVLDAGLCHVAKPVTVPTFLVKRDDQVDPRCIRERVVMGCHADQVEDATLCYKPCGEGWTGRGPVCWKGWKSYGRGVGVLKVDSCEN